MSRQKFHPPRERREEMRSHSKQDHRRWAGKGVEAEAGERE